MRSALTLALAMNFFFIHSAVADIRPVVTAGCSASVKKTALTVITSQAKALGKQDFTAAMAFSTADFRMGISVGNFTEIITQSYKFLMDTKNPQFVSCRPNGKSFYIDVKLVDSEGKVFFLTYLVQRQSKSELIAPNKTGFGIAAAQITPEVITS